MTQRHLDRAVARATGESVATIRRLGFGLAAPDSGRHRPFHIPARRTKEPRRAPAA